MNIIERQRDAQSLSGIPRADIEVLKTRRFTYTHHGHQYIGKEWTINCPSLGLVNQNVAQMHHSAEFALLPEESKFDLIRD